jgi:hypothetical protein
MLKVLVWTACLYAGLKFGALITGAGLRFGREQATWAERLRSGEPKLLVGTLGLCALRRPSESWDPCRGRSGARSGWMPAFAGMTKKTETD